MKVNPEKVAQYEDELRPLRNDRSPHTQSFASAALSRIDGESHTELAASADEYTEATRSRADTGTTKTKIFDPGNDDDTS